MCALALVFVPGATAATNLSQKAGTAGCITETGTAGECQDGRGLVGAASIALSPDGNNAYVASSTWNSLSVLTRNPVDGTLAPIQSQAGCLEALDRVLAEGRERIVADLPVEAAWPQRVCAGLRSLLGLIAEAPLRARIVLVEAQTAGPEALARSNAALEEVTAYLRAGRDCTAPDAKLPGMLEEAIVGGLLWLLQQQLVGGLESRAAELFPELAAIVLEPYLGEAEARRVIEAQPATVSAG